MKIWNRVFLMDCGRQGESSPVLVDIHKYINSVSDYGYNLWATVIGTLGEYGAAALVPDFYKRYAANVARLGSPAATQSNVMYRLV